MNALVFRPLASIAWILPGGSLVELARRSMGFGVAILAVSVVVAQALATFDPGPTAPSHAARPIAQPDLAAVVRPIRVTLGDDSLVLDEARLAAVATVARARVVIDADALDDLVAAIAAELDVPARDAVLRASGGGFAIVPDLAGRRVDRADLANRLAVALLSGDGGQVVRPRVLPSSAAIGAERLATAVAVSAFTTHFPANRARATNIKLAAARLDGQVVKSGETFSFWARLGDVSYESGFVDAGAIIDGRSDKALAGGICQVSTTLFNAVARAGYRIDERHAHSYYIERYPIGLDAAVFLPAEDFRWTNDTSDAVLIRSFADDASVTFRLYSVPSGRDVTFGAPIQRNLVLPDTKQAADPAYPAGYVVRGRDVLATRTISKDGSVIRRDTWASQYLPVWGGPAVALTLR